MSDSSALIRQKKQSLLEEALRLIRGGKELGIRRGEFIRVIDRIYQKEDADDRTEEC